MTGEPWDMRQIFEHLQGGSCCWGKSAPFQVHGKRAPSTDWGQIGVAEEGKTIPRLPWLWADIANNAGTDAFPQTSSCPRCALPLAPILQDKIFEGRNPQKTPNKPPLVDGWVLQGCWGMGAGSLETAQLSPASSSSSCSWDSLGHRQDWQVELDELWHQESLRCSSQLC